MSFSDERKAIELRLTTQFTDLPVKLENQPFDQPTNSPWVELIILPGNGRQISIGKKVPLQRYPGVLQFTIFAPEDQGSHTAKTHADSIDAIFRDVSFSEGNSGTIRTGVGQYFERGVINGWYRGVLSVPYMRTRNF